MNCSLDDCWCERGHCCDLQLQVVRAENSLQERSKNEAMRCCPLVSKKAGGPLLQLHPLLAQQGMTGQLGVGQ